MDRKLLINCSNLFVGGGVQVAVSFLSELCEFDLNRDKICIVVSNKIAMQLSRKNLDKYKMLVVDRKPSSLWRGSKTRRQLKELERKFMPEVVFTVFGPAYWRPKCRHIVGFANPWILYPKSEAYKLISFRKRFLARLKYKFYEYRFRQEADLFVVEAEHVKNKLISICRIKEEKVEVVSNTFSMFFNKDLKIEVDISKYHNGLFKFLTISHDYPHKNLNIIGDVYKILKKNDCQVKFFVTISNDSYEKMSNNFKEATFNI
jgi:glycosyltransferase involved in cell wall biosynthesis